MSHPTRRKRPRSLLQNHQRTSDLGHLLNHRCADDKGKGLDTDPSAKQSADNGNKSGNQPYADDFP